MPYGFGGGYRPRPYGYGRRRYGYRPYGYGRRRRRYGYGPSIIIIGRPYGYGGRRKYNYGPYY